MEAREMVVINAEEVGEAYDNDKGYSRGSPARPACYLDELRCATAIWEISGRRRVQPWMGL
jgi:hypothetical protein